MGGEGGTAGWTGVYPIEDLPKQIAFYRGLRDRRNGAYAVHYRETVEALEAVAREAARPL